MVELISLEVYNSTFTITERNKKLELYTDTFDEFSVAELKDEVEVILSISDFTPKHLQQEKLGPRFFQAYKKLGSEKSSLDGYLILLLGYARSAYRDFESYLRIYVVLEEDDIQ